MRDVDFQNILQGIREAGSDLRGNKKATSRVDCIDPESVAAIRTKLRLSRKAFSPRSSPARRSRSERAD